MPFKSEAQRRLLWAKHPKLAKRWAHEYKTPKDLPYHVDDEDGKEKEKMAAQDFNERVVEAIQIAGAALEKATIENNEKQASYNKYASRVPSTVEKLAKWGRIDDTPEDRKILAEKLATAEGALEVIEMLAEYAPAEKTAAAMGTPVDRSGRPAQTAVNKASRFVGGGRVGAKTSEKSAADVKFEMDILGRALGE